MIGGLLQRLRTRQRLFRLAAMDPMNPGHLIAAVEWWQANPLRETLLCREIAHGALEPRDRGGSVVLCCLACNYKTVIPDYVLEARDQELSSRSRDVGDVA